MDFNAEYLANKIIKAKFCSEIFTQNIDSVNKDYKKFLKVIHPDLNGGDRKFVEATQKLTELHDKAIKLLGRGEWDEGNVVYFPLVNGKKLKVKYLKEMPFELGRSFVCQNYIIYFIDEKYSAYYRRYHPETIVNAGRYDNRLQEILKSIKMAMPLTTNTYSCKNGFLVIQHRNYGEIPLSLVLKYYNNHIPAEHVAWIMTRLLNIECYFMSVNYTYNAFDINNLYVLPENHLIILHGGFWYSTRFGDKLVGLSNFVYQNVTGDTKKNGISEVVDDFWCIKAIGRNLIGARSKLSKVDCPKPLLDYLFNKSFESKNQYQIMTEWEKIIHDSFGKRKFVEMKINKNLLED